MNLLKLSAVFISFFLLAGCPNQNQSADSYGDLLACDEWLSFYSFLIQATPTLKLKQPTILTRIFP